jgi:hypothetical protein
MATHTPVATTPDAPILQRPHSTPPLAARLMRPGLARPGVAWKHADAAHILANAASRRDGRHSARVAERPTAVNMRGDASP